MFRFGSVCSGIEAASVAWSPLGWEAAWFAEIEPFPCAVLAHHYPQVPNLGDMTALPAAVLAGDVEAPDVLCGGTPCQAFSVAGLRRSLDDERGNLTLSFVELADAVDAVRVADNRPAGIIVWENVPGVLSTADNAFGCFLAGLAGESDPLVPAGGKWTHSGCVFGPQRAVAWRVLDAQYFGLAQRRKRVFVVASARDDFHPAEVLLEFQGSRRDHPPGRPTGQGAAAGAARGAGSGGEQPYAVANCLTQRMHKGINTTLDEGQTPVVVWAQDVADPITANEGRTYTHEGTNNFRTRNVQAVAIDTYNQTVTGDLTQTLCSRGDNKGGNAHLVPAVAFVKATSPHSADEAPRYEEAEVAACLNPWDERREPPKHMVVEPLYNQGIRQGARDADAEKAGPVEALRALRSAVGEEAFLVWGLGVLAQLSHAEVLRDSLHGTGLRPAPFSRSWVVNRALSREKSGTAWLLQSLRETGCIGCPPQGWEPPEQLAGELGAYLSSLSQPGPQASRFLLDLWGAAEGARVLWQALPAVQEVGRPTGGQGQPTQAGSKVRRLTVEECEFLMGFPRGYTDIPWRGKAAADAPRYKALGNSWAVPVVRWIGERIVSHLTC